MSTGSQTGVAPAPAKASVGQIISNYSSAFKDHGATLAGLFAAWTFDAMDATVYAYAVPSIMKDLKVSMAEAPLETTRNWNPASANICCRRAAFSG